jgi:hypothetical protein
LSNDDLLRPTLSDYRKPPALYHSTGFFLAAFFGGPVGAGVYAAANAWRLGRLARDLPVIVGIVAAAFLGLLELHRAGALEALADWLGGSLARNLGLFLRALGIATFGAIYFLHRGFFRAAQISGTKPLPGWMPGILAVGLGLAANEAFDAWILGHH